ncbi:putative disease resistance RPP8-like protein 4 [Bienertia sinuspersici]
MAISSIESVSKFLGNLLVEEVQNLAAVQGKVEELQRQLEYMQRFLSDVDKNQCKNAPLRKWVLEIKDLAYEAEDLIETYILKVSHEEQNDGCLLNTLKWLICCLKDAKTLHNVGSNIDALTAKIKTMSSSLNTYGVKSSYGNHMEERLMVAELRRTYAHVEERNIVGVEESVAQLVERLQGGCQETIVSKFDGFAWAYVSQQLNLGAVCKDILLNIIPENERASVQWLQDSQLLEKLYHMLKQKKILVVLDDVWFNNDWKRLQPAFPLSDTSHGSKLLITTRDPQILFGSGLTDDLVFYFPLNFLDQEKSWQLLQKSAHFQKQDIDHIMVELGDKMLDHCKGHPLAIAVLGGVLSTKKLVEEWKSISDNLPSHLQGDDEYTGVYEVLAMSYYELSYHIKPCFLHLGYFPEDFDIPVERLYNLWIAEGIVSEVGTKRSGRSLEDICEVYMNELLQKNMVQVGRRNKYGKIKTCRLHDLMRDKCLEINKEENYLQFIDSQACKSEQEAAFNTPNEKLRRMGIYVDDEEVPNNPILNSMSGKTPPLRSILFTSPEYYHLRDCGFIQGLCKGFELLRVLDFEGLGLLGSLPKEVGSLMFLRYLSLKGENRIIELPSSIQNLRSIMILDLRQEFEIMMIPNLIWKMKSLRHLYLPTGYAYEIKEGKMLKLEQLSQLEKIENVDLDRVDADGLVKLAGTITTLKARCKSNKESLVPFLKSKSIKSLSLRIHANIVKDDPTFLSTCHSLKFLRCFNEAIYEVPLPMIHEMFPPNLVKLVLYGCTFPADPMLILEKLSKLKILKLFFCYDGNEMVCTEKGFPELTHLTFDGFSFLRNWIVKEGGLPKLQEVYMHNSPNIILSDVLPSHVSITCDPCVRGIEQYGTCPNFRDDGGGGSDGDSDGGETNDSENSVVEGGDKDGVDDDEQAGDGPSNV